MQKKDPLVSVIVPAYNAETWIERTLNSVLAQTYTNIEVLVVDDGSQDRTGQIVKSFAEKDNRVRLIKQENAGVAAARNFAIEKSAGDYVAPLDADDIWHPEKLQKQVQCLLSAGPSVGLVYAWHVFIDEADMILGPIDIPAHEDFNSVEGNVLPALVYSNLVGCGSVPLIRRSCVERVGGYSTLLRAGGGEGCEDWYLYLRIAEQYEFRVVREFLVGYRRTPTCMSMNVKAMARSHDLVMASIRHEHPEIPDWVYKLSESNFAFSLSGASANRADYAAAVIFALKAIRFDRVRLLLPPRFMAHLLKLLLKLVLSPLIRRAGLDPPTWFRETKRKLVVAPDGVAADHVSCIFDNRVPTGNARLDPVKRYGVIRWRRWLRILEMCQR